MNGLCSSPSARKTDPAAKSGRITFPFTPPSPGHALASAATSRTPCDAVNRTFHGRSMNLAASGASDPRPYPEIADPFVFRPARLGARSGGGPPPACSAFSPSWPQCEGWHPSLLGQPRPPLQGAGGPPPSLRLLRVFHSGLPGGNLFLFRLPRPQHLYPGLPMMPMNHRPMFRAHPSTEWINLQRCKRIVLSPAR